jgi:hypothetical protein
MLLINGRFTPVVVVEEIDMMFAAPKRKIGKRTSNARYASTSDLSQYVMEDSSLQLSDAGVPELRDNFHNNDEQPTSGMNDNESLEHHLCPPILRTASCTTILPTQLMSRSQTIPLSPFEEEIQHLKKDSEKLAAQILTKARRTISSDESFQQRKISQAEIRLLNR